MVSPTPVLIPERGTQAEIDLIPTAPAGSSIWNTTTGVMNITLDGGTPPTWTVDSLPNDTNKIPFLDDNGNIKATTSLQYDEPANTVTIEVQEINLNASGKITRTSGAINSISNTHLIDASTTTIRNNGDVVLIIEDASQAVDERMWSFQYGSSSFQLSALNDDETHGSNAFNISRNGSTIQAISFPPAVTFGNIVNVEIGPLYVGVLSAEPSAIFDVVSTTQGSLPIPRMTEAERDLIPSPATGLQVENTTSGNLERFNGATWDSIGGSSPLPGGNDQVLFNNGSGDVSTDPAFSYDVATKILSNDGDITVSGNGSAVVIENPTAAIDEKNWRMQTTGNDFQFLTKSDDGLSEDIVMNVTRSGESVSQVRVGPNAVNISANVDNDNIQITSDSVTQMGQSTLYGFKVSNSYSPRMIYEFDTNDVIEQGDLLTTDEAAGQDFHVRKITTVDPSDQPVIGSAEELAIGPNTTVRVSGAALMRVRSDSVTTFAVGDGVERSSVDDGRVEDGTFSIGTIGICAQVALPNTEFWVLVSQNRV